MSCAKCKDDYVWATNFGGCKSYNTDGPNHAFCAEDGADVACPASCGTCPCPGAGEEEETDLTVFYVLGAIAISIFCIPVLVMWVRRGHAHVKERKRGVLSKFRNYRSVGHTGIRWPGYSCSSQWTAFSCTDCVAPFAGKQGYLGRGQGAALVQDDQVCLCQCL